MSGSTSGPKRFSYSKKMSLSLEAGVIYNVQRGVKNKTALSLPPDDAHTTACNPIHCEMESTVINLDIA